jgi:hypothetical protein
VFHGHVHILASTSGHDGENANVFAFQLFCYIVLDFLSLVGCWVSVVGVGCRGVVLISVLVSGVGCRMLTLIIGCRF